MSIKTPVAFLIFNRPEVTARVFQAIAQAKPAKLLVVADGPRSAAEAEKCERTRAVIRSVDWDCEVLTDFSEANLGCKRRVASGISWVFSQVEEAIILEDDCLPVLSFFRFCEELLQIYRDDERVMHIGGNNFLPEQFPIADSYYFSKYIFPWGWGTWRRAWASYDEAMKSWPEFKRTNLMRNIFDNPEERLLWAQRFDMAFNGEIDTWDFQWFYHCWSQNGLGISPRVNMVSNLGFHAEATHTKTAHEKGILANRPAVEVDGDLLHPQFVVERKDADAYVFENCFRPNQSQPTERLGEKIVRYARRLPSRER